MKHSLFLKACALLVLISTDALASGGYTGGGGGGFSSGSSSQQRQVDQTYEVGKSIYLGRQAGAPELSYCVMVEGDKVPVKRRTLKSFKHTNYNDLAANLYDCDEPDKKIVEKLGRDDFLYVVYYLNKRHKLQLKSS